MAVHKISVKQLISRVRQVFPDAPDTYILNLINDALVEIGMHSTKPVSSRISLVENQMWYDIGDGANDSSGKALEANKVYRVDILDNEGDYIQIPRLVDKNILLMDVFQETGEVLSFTPNTSTAITTLGEAGGVPNSATGAWTANQTHADVAPHNVGIGGSGADTLRVTITTNSSGHPKLTAITTASLGYKVGDYVTFVSPGNSEKATWTVNEIRYTHESAVERSD